MLPAPHDQGMSQVTHHVAARTRCHTSVHNSLCSMTNLRMAVHVWPDLRPSTLKQDTSAAFFQTQPNSHAPPLDSRPRMPHHCNNSTQAPPVQPTAPPARSPGHSPSLSSVGSVLVTASAWSVVRPSRPLALVHSLTTLKQPSKDRKHRRDRKEAMQQRQTQGAAQAEAATGAHAGA
eukprot:m.86682 g.86682  ORF g.86682 m.86682 type:complete len:177 (+) comp50938_c0_seq1:900-1430(+)